MSCSRCGQSRVKPVYTPTAVSRPASVVVPARAVAAVAPSAPLPSNVIRNAINGLRYIPPIPPNGK